MKNFKFIISTDNYFRQAVDTSSLCSLQCYSLADEELSIEMIGKFDLVNVIIASAKWRRYFPAVAIEYGDRKKPFRISR